MDDEELGQGRRLLCHRCSHEWTYRGTQSFAASCPRCKTSVTFARSDLRMAVRDGKLRKPAPTDFRNRINVAAALQRR